MRGTIGAQLSGARVAQTTGLRGQPRSDRSQRMNCRTRVNHLAKRWL